MQSKATTVEQYLRELPPERREAISAIRGVILRNLDKDYEEVMQYGMIGYCVPHRIYPAGYHCDPRQPLPFASLASQKNHMAVYLMSIYGPDSDEPWFRDAWMATGKKLDMGKCCVRFKRLEDVPLEVVGEAIRRVPAARWIEYYERAIRTTGTGASERSPAKKGVAKKAAKKTAKTSGKKVAKKAGKKVAKRAAKKPAKRAAARR